MFFEKRIDLRKLRHLRETHQLTQLDVAKHLGYKTALGYHYIESGRCRLKAEQALILARLYGIPVEELFVDDAAPASVNRMPSDEARTGTG